MVSRQAHLQRDYIALGHTEQATATGDGPTTAGRAADHAPDKRRDPGSGARVGAGTNTASEPTCPLPRTAPPCGRGHLDYARLEGGASRPSDHAEQAAAKASGMWIHRLTTGEQLALAVSIRWLLTLRDRHLGEGTRTMADLIFGHRTGHTPSATMADPDQWHYVATQLMAHMGAYHPDEMNRVHWQWHQRAALRIRAAMQSHNIWDIPGSPGYQGHASGRRRPRSLTCRSPPGRQRAVTPQSANGGHQPEWVPPLARTEAPSDRSRRRGAQAVLRPGGCKAARRSSARRQGPLAAPASGAARRLPRHGESSATRIRTEAMEVAPNSTPNGHHLPPTSDAGPRGPAPNGRTSPPFPRQSSASDRQRSVLVPTGQQTERPAHPPPPSQPREPAADQRPAQGVGGQPPQHPPPPQAGRDDIGRGHGHRSPDKPGPCSTGFPTSSATRPSHQGAEDAPQQLEHDASGPGADAEMTGTSGPQESDDPLPTAASFLMPPQQEPSMGYVPGEHPGTTPGHPSPTGVTPDQDRETMTPPAPRPPQRRNTGPFDNAELRVLYGIHATTPSSELVAALQEHLRDVNPSRLFAAVPLPHTATIEIFVRQL